MGASPTRSVIEGQRDLLVAQNRLLQAKLDMIKSRIAMDKAVGDIFAAYNIELTKTLGCSSKLLLASWRLGGFGSFRNDEAGCDCNRRRAGRH